MENKIKKNVLRRVKVIFYLRKLLNPFNLEVFIFAITLVSLWALTSVPNIVSNFAAVDGLSGVWKLTLSAFGSTEVTIQLLFTLFILSLTFIAKDLVQRKAPLFLEKDNYFSS